MIHQLMHSNRHTARCTVVFHCSVLRVTGSLCVYVFGSPRVVECDDMSYFFHDSALLSRDLLGVKGALKGDGAIAGFVFCQRA